MRTELGRTYMSYMEWMNKINKIIAPSDTIREGYIDDEPVIMLNNSSGCLLSAWFENTEEVRDF